MAVAWRGHESPVDSEKCQGHNRCYALAPGLFKVDEFGYATERGDGTVPPEISRRRQLAVENCPERAISMIEEEGDEPAS